MHSGYRGSLGKGANRRSHGCRIKTKAHGQWSGLGKRAAQQAEESKQQERKDHVHAAADGWLVHWKEAHGRTTPCALRRGAPVGRAGPLGATPARLSNRDDRLPPPGMPSTCSKARLGSAAAVRQQASAATGAVGCALRCTSTLCSSTVCLAWCKSATAGSQL